LPSHTQASDDKVVFEFNLRDEIPGEASGDEHHTKARIRATITPRANPREQGCELKD